MKNKTIRSLKNTYNKIVESDVKYSVNGLQTAFSSQTR